MAIAAASSGVFAQHADCGVRVDPSMADMLVDRRAELDLGSAPSSDAPLRVGIAFHIVRSSAGLGGLNEREIAPELASVNDFFDHIEFYQAGPVRYVDDDRFVYTGIDEFDALRSIDPVPGVVNAFYVPDMPFCGYGSFTHDDVQGLIVHRACANRSTLAHEVGHYFDLYHPYSTTFGEECPDGRNCQTAGDLICDTPADPGLAGKVGPDCAYMGTDVRCGDVFDPDTANLMTNAPRRCRASLTPQQQEVARQTLLVRRPDHVACPADLDADGVLTIFDFLAFQRLFEAGSMLADFDGDGELTVFDFLAFQASFDAGCP